MELRHLRYFTAVAEEQNVTRAAARLHVSQPPLSRQIRDLEEELGVKLFKRTAKSIVLTEAGRLFLNEARAVLLRAEEAIRTVRAAANPMRGQVRIGYAPSLTVELLPKALKRFEEEQPGARVALRDCSTEEGARLLGEQKLDVVLGARPAGTLGRGIAFEKLVSYPLCCAVAVSHPLSSLSSVNLRQINNERLIGYAQDEYPEYALWLRGLFGALKLNPRLAEEHDSVTSLIAAVEAGRGVAVAPWSLRCLSGPRLKLLPIRPAPPPLIVGAIFKAPLSEVASQFIAAVRKSA
jgi:DNA-binding transcriptional LysR family regulator